MDAVLFDIDDTIYDQAVPFAYAIHAVMGTAPAVSDGELYATSRRHSGAIFAAFGRGERPSKACYIRRMRETLADFGISVSDEQASEMQRVYVFESGAAMRLSDEMEQTIAWCAQRCSRGIGFISNGTWKHQLAKLRVLGCDRWASEQDAFISDELGVAKPDPRIFLYACRKKNARPEQTLFVGDSYDIDVVGARAAGMPVVWLNRRGRPMPAEVERDPLIWVISTEKELFSLIQQLVQSA